MTILISSLVLFDLAKYMLVTSKRANFNLMLQYRFIVKNAGCAKIILFLTYSIPVPGKQTRPTTRRTKT